MALPAVGSPAPDFTLSSTSGEDVTLSALAGEEGAARVLSARLHQHLHRRDLRLHRGLRQVPGRGHRGAPDSGGFGADAQGVQGARSISVDLLSDFKREVSRKYGTLIEESSTRAGPTSSSTGRASSAGPSWNRRRAHGAKTPRFSSSWQSSTEPEHGESRRGATSVRRGPVVLGPAA